MPRSGGQTADAVDRSGHRRDAMFIAALLALPDRTTLQLRLADLAGAIDVPMAGICIHYGHHRWFPVTHGFDQAAQTALRSGGGHGEIAALGISAQNAVPFAGAYGVELGTLFVADRTPHRDFAETSMPSLFAMIGAIHDDMRAPHQIHRFRDHVIAGFEALIGVAVQGAGDPMPRVITELMEGDALGANSHRWSMDL